MTCELKLLMVIATLKQLNHKVEFFSGIFRHFLFHSLRAQRTEPRKGTLVLFSYKTYLSQERKPSGILLFHSVSTSFPSLAQDVLFDVKEQIGFKTGSFFMEKIDILLEKMVRIDYGH